MTDPKSTYTFHHEDSCPFCAIATGTDDRVEVVCADHTWVAFFPNAPATPGHTLVIPRKHVRDLWSADSELRRDLMDGVSKVGEAIRRAVEPEGMNLITSAGEAAEQTVFHLHLHLVPRWAEDRLDIWPPKRSMAKELERGLASAVRDACAES